MKESRIFLRRVWAKRSLLGKARALDCGAGIGRVARDLLAPLFGHVDLVEQSARLLEESKVALADCEAQVGMRYCSTLQVRCCSGIGRCSAVLSLVSTAPLTLAIATVLVHVARFLQEFSPPDASYDVIWLQWCVGYLTDADFVACLQRLVKVPPHCCPRSLCPVCCPPC